MKFSLSTVFLLLAAASIALAWNVDRRFWNEEVSKLRLENSQLSVAHKDKDLRRQNVLKLITNEPDEGMPALITALSDEDVRIAMEARAGLESMTKVSFRTQLPNTATKRDLLLCLREEQSKWQQWFDENCQGQ